MGGLVPREGEDSHGIVDISLSDDAPSVVRRICGELILVNQRGDCELKCDCRAGCACCPGKRDGGGLASVFEGSSRDDDASVLDYGSDSLGKVACVECRIVRGGEERKRDRRHRHALDQGDFLRCAIVVLLECRKREDLQQGLRGRGEAAVLDSLESNGELRGGGCLRSRES